MATTVPVALNVISFEFLWLTFRDPATGQWGQSTKVYTSQFNDGPADFGISQFCAGAVTQALASNLGIITMDLNVTGTSNDLYFVGNGVASPIRIGSDSKYSILYRRWNGLTGCFFFDGKYFALLVDNSAADKYLKVLMSSDGGATWSEQDSANSPIWIKSGGTGTQGDATISDVYWDGTSSAFYLIYQFPSLMATNRVQILKFDMSSSSWVIVHDGSNEFRGLSGVPKPLQSSVALQVICGTIQSFANGDLGFLYTFQDNGAPASLFFRKFSGGAWGTEISVRPNPYGIARTIVDPTNDLIHCFAYTGVAGPDGTFITGPVEYFQISHTGVVSASLGTLPATASTGPGGVGSDGVGFGCLDPNSGLILIPRDDFEDEDNAIWEAPILGPYNFVKKTLTRPPEEPPLNSGGFIFSPSCSLVFFGLMNTSVSLSCPVSGAATVGSAYSGTLIASGGIGPYTFSIISGSLPPGLTLNTSTGVISGIPTNSGTFPYTAQVNDSNNKTVTVSCSFTIAPSGSGSKSNTDYPYGCP